MPQTYCQGSSSPLTNFSRSIPTMDGPIDPRDQELQLETFQKHVADKFMELSSATSDELLSLNWVRNLLHVFISCQEKFHIIFINTQINNNSNNNNKHPAMDRLFVEFHERSVKALDVCNAIRDGIEQVRQWEKLLDIVMCSLHNDNNNGNQKSTLGEGQIRRAKKALVELLIGMLDEKESNVALSSHRNRSFGSRNNKDGKNLGHFRSLSWSVSRSWSASKQLQAMGGSLNAPKGNDIMATNGLALCVYTMSCVLVVVMTALVAAIPCQDRGLQTHFSVPKQFVWGAPVSALHDRIVEESKKRDRKNVCGLLKEIYQTEKWTRQMNELLDSLQFPLGVEKEAEVREKVEELRVVFESLKDGLQPLERQVREVFHRIVRCRTEAQQ